MPETPRCLSGCFLGTSENVGEIVLSSLLVSVQGTILNTREELVGGRLARNSKGVGLEASSALFRVMEKESYACNLYVGFHSGVTKDLLIKGLSELEERTSQSETS